MFAVVHAISWGSRWLVFEPFARRSLQANITTTTINKKRYCSDDATLEKFSQSSNAAVFHLLSSYFAWRIVGQKPWLWSVQEWGNDIQSLNTIDLDFKFYYLLYAARYISDLLSLLFEHTRSVRSLDVFAASIFYCLLLKNICVAFLILLMLLLLPCYLYRTLLPMPFITQRVSCWFFYRHKLALLALVE